MNDSVILLSLPSTYSYSHSLLLLSWYQVSKGHLGDHLDLDLDLESMAQAVDSVWGYDHNVVVTDQAQYLTDDEISRFLDDLDRNGDGLIDYDEVEKQLDAVHDEIIPQPREHNFLARKKTTLLRRLTRASHAHPGNSNNNNHANNNTFPIPIIEELGPHDGGNLTATTTRTTTTAGGLGVEEGQSIAASRMGGGLRRSISSAASKLGGLARSHSTVTARGAGAGAGATSHSQSNRSPAHNLRHEFLRSIIGSDARQIPRDAFAQRVKQWKIPSLELSEHESHRDYVRKMSFYRRVRAYWAVHGPEIAFLMLVISLQLAFGTWQLVKYTTGSQYRDAFGWGVGLAKAFAGALYPTMFFLIISMSRYASTFLRRSYYVSRFINWDLSQSFHIKIAVVALILATLHTIGHLTGTFNVGSQEDREEEVAAVLGADDVPIPYSHYIVSLPGLTGITALSLFYVLALLSMPQVRKWNYEVFQLGHLLMYPIIGLLFAHGTSGFLQWPMLGYWMALPTLLILVERTVRIGVGFHNLTATVRILDGETVEVTVMIPSGRFWAYKPGQYVFFQVPRISRFQWHPFTVSVCVGKKMQLHIKTDGNWTGKLRELADKSGEPTEIVVGINGPFGAPAQRFYEFNHAIVVGSGIGVTPFSGILSDLQAKDDALNGGPGDATHKVHDDWNGFSSTTESERLPAVREDEKAPDEAAPDEMAPDERAPDDVDPLSGPPSPDEKKDGYKDRTKKSKSAKKDKETPDYRRVDFHWTVRERNYLLWMSELLNSVFLSQQWHRQQKLKEQQQSIPHIDNNPQAQLGLPLSNIARQNSYIPPLSLPSTPAHRPSPNPEAHNQSRPQSQRPGPEELEDFDTLPHLDIRIHTHVTGILSKSRSIATHVFAWLLEMHRTVTHPTSPLTGLLNPTQFGRPDFVTILDNHYEDMVRLKAREARRKEAGRERERERRAREKERRAREKEWKKERRERGLGHGHSHRKSTNSVSSFRSGLTNKYYGGGGNAGARASAVSFGGGGNGNGNSGARLSAVSFGGGGNGNNGARLSAVSFGGGGGDRNSHSDLTLTSTGRVDSLYVYSSATVSRNPSSAGGGHSEVESPTGTEKTTAIGGSGSGVRGDDVLRVGVFYCGTPAVGEILADRCRALTARGHADGTGIEYHFMTEVFG